MPDPLHSDADHDGPGGRDQQSNAERHGYRAAGWFVDNRIESNTARRNAAWGINSEAGFFNVFETNKCKANALEDGVPAEVCS